MERIWLTLDIEAFQLMPGNFGIAVAMLNEEDRKRIKELSFKELKHYVVVFNDPDFDHSAKLYGYPEFWQLFEMKYEKQPTGLPRQVIKK